MKLLAIIDPIETLNPKKDSTIAMLQAAQGLGCEIFYTTQANLYCDQGIAKGLITTIKTLDNEENWYQLGKQSNVLLGDIDIILMRKDPPFNNQYIYTTYLLELAQTQGAMVSNHPQSLRDANEKYFIMQFASLIAPTLISQSITQLKSFYQMHKPAIAKPLDGMGGKSIFYLNEQGHNVNVILETLTQNQTMPIMLQRYLPAIKNTGDKRVLIIGDKIIPYGLARFPSSDEMRGNLAVGGTGKVVDITEQEKKLAQAILPSLQKMHLDFVGIDIIDNTITEINVTSPTCIREIENESKLPIAKMLIEYLINKRR